VADGGLVGRVVVSNEVGLSSGPIDEIGTLEVLSEHDEAIGDAMDCGCDQAGAGGFSPQPVPVVRRSCGAGGAGNEVEGGDEEGDLVLGWRVGW